MIRLVVAALALGVLLYGCSDGGSNDEILITADGDILAPGYTQDNGVSPLDDSSPDDEEGGEESDECGGLLPADTPSIDDESGEESSIPQGGISSGNVPESGEEGSESGNVPESGQSGTPSSGGGGSSTVQGGEKEYTKATLTNNDVVDGVCYIQSKIEGKTVNEVIAGGRLYGVAAFKVDADNECFSVVDGVLFNKDKSTLIMYPPEKRGNYSIPSFVKTIKKSAFKRCSITQLSIENAGLLETMEDNAFASCKDLTNADLKGAIHLKTIGSSAFSSCTSLRSVDLSGAKMLETIGDKAFSNCTALAFIDLSGASSLKSVKSAAFKNCKALVRKSAIFYNVKAITERAPDAFDDTQLDWAFVTSVV